MPNVEVSKLGVIFAYDTVANRFYVALHYAHVLPPSEAERVWLMSKTYAASHPARPTLVLEVAEHHIEYGPIDPVAARFFPQPDMLERHCLALMSQSAPRNQKEPSGPMSGW